MFLCELGDEIEPIMSKEWIDMKNTCYDKVRGQINMEVDASYTYLSMAAYFSRDDVNMPGFAHMFFEHASEERSHAQALVEYLLMRGYQDGDKKLTKSLITTPVSTFLMHCL